MNDPVQRRAQLIAIEEAVTRNSTATGSVEEMLKGLATILVDSARDPEQIYAIAGHLRDRSAFFAHGVADSQAPAPSGYQPPTHDPLSPARDYNGNTLRNADNSPVTYDQIRSASYRNPDGTYGPQGAYRDPMLDRGERGSDDRTGADVRGRGVGVGNEPDRLAGESDDAYRARLQAEADERDRATAAANVGTAASRASNKK